MLDGSDSFLLKESIYLSQIEGRPRDIAVLFCSLTYSSKNFNYSSMVGLLMLVAVCYVSSDRMIAINEILFQDFHFQL